MEILLTALYFLVMLWLIDRWSLFKIDGLEQAWMRWSFVLKVFAGVALWFIYSRFYSDAPRWTLDTFKFMDDASYLHLALLNEPKTYLKLMIGMDGGEEALRYVEGMNNWTRSYSLIAINDNKTMIRLNAILQIFSGGHYHVHSLFFNFFSFTGLVLTFKGLRKLVELPPKWFILAFILPPSLLLWASGILKESLVILFGGIFLFHFFSWIKGKKGWRVYLGMLSGAMLFMSIKPYVFLAFLPGLLFLILNKISKSREIINFLLAHGGALILLLCGSLNPRTDLIGILSLKRDAFVNVAQDTRAGSAIEIPPIETFWAFLAAAPGAVYNTLLRPGLWEADSLVGLLSAIENLIYLSLILLTAVFIRKRYSSGHLILFCASVVIGLCWIVGSVTPVLGAIVRYKVPMLPFLIVLLLSLIDMERLKGYFPFLRSL